MRKIVLLLTCFSSIAMAGSGLDEAVDLAQVVTKAQNEVNVKQVAKALICAETNQQCITSLVYQQGNVGQSSRLIYDVVTYEQDLDVLRVAKDATQTFNSDDLLRISKGIELLEQKRLERSSK